MQITGYGYHHKHGYSAKKASDKGQKRAFRPLRRKSNSPFQELKSDAQTNLRMLHGILVFYVSSPHFEHHKIHFQNLVCPKCAQIPVFHRKLCAEKASWKSPRSLIFQWQRGWDSNPRWLITTLDFESSTFDHSDTSPQRYFASLPHLFPLVKGRVARFLVHCARCCTILAKWMLVRAYSVPKMRSPASPRPGQI